MRWDLFCRVIDNLGDAGVCWRLAADLAARGDAVRLWIDDPAPLARIAAPGARGVQVLPWDESAVAAQPGDVVVEAFGCNPPADFVARMALLAQPAVWINLEHLSAEDYVERCHGLPSPQMAVPGRGLTKHFFFPGFTTRTGGLLREPGLMAARQAFERDAWLASRGLPRRPGERVVLVFCYANPALPALLHALAADESPSLLLAAPGPAAEQVRAALGPAMAHGRLRAASLPWMPQPEFDRALWSADLNLVRGEDSLVRAQWAGAPFVWQIYPQHDGAHRAKLDAFLQRHLHGASPVLDSAVRAVWQAWNRPLAGRWPALPPADAWGAHTRHWREGLLAQPDLVTQLRAFVSAQAEAATGHG